MEATIANACDRWKQPLQTRVTTPRGRRLTPSPPYPLSFLPLPTPSPVQQEVERVRLSSAQGAGGRVRLGAAAGGRLPLPSDKEDVAAKESGAVVALPLTLLLLLSPRSPPFPQTRSAPLQTSPVPRIPQLPPP